MQRNAQHSGLFGLHLIVFHRTRHAETGIRVVFFRHLNFSVVYCEGHAGRQAHFDPSSESAVLLRGTHRYDRVFARCELARVQVHVEGLHPCAAIGQIAVLVRKGLLAAGVRIFEERHLTAVLIYNCHADITVKIIR